MSATESTTTRRRAGPGIASGIGDDNFETESAADLELSRWTLDEETKPLSTGGSAAGDEESSKDGGGGGGYNNINRGNAPLTVKLTDYIEPEQEKEYLTWQKGISTAMEETVSQDNVGSILLKEALTDGRLRFVILFRFRNRESAAQWHTSSTRREWLKKLTNSSFHRPNDPAHFTMSDSSYNPVPIFDVTQPIPDDVSFTAQPRPQRWRTAFLVWLQVYALVELFGVLLPLIFGHTTWGSIHFHLQLIISTAITTLTIEVFTMQLFVKTARVLGFLKSV